MASVEPGERLWNSKVTLSTASVVEKVPEATENETLVCAVKGRGGCILVIMCGVERLSSFLVLRERLFFVRSRL